MCIAEKTSDVPGIKTGKDYFFHVKKALDQAPLQITYPKDIYTDTVGGVSFYVMPVDMVINGTKIHQEHYAAIQQGYALTFALSYVNEEQRMTLKQVLANTSIE